MKKIVVLGMGLCVALAFSSCKSSESAYKKAYEKAISYAKQALEKKKEDALAYAVIGKCYLV
jgi:hypothetical protein